MDKTLKPAELERSEKRLKELIESLALRFGPVELASGKTSHYYFDVKKISLHPEGLCLAAETIFSRIEHMDIDAIGGLEIGAIPIAAAVIQLAHHKERSLKAFVVRKQIKEHGARERIAGYLQPGDKVVIFDDVLTTGSSILQAIEEVEARGGKVIRILVLIDRLEGGREFLKSKGYEVETIFTREDFGINDEYLERISKQGEKRVLPQ